MPYVREKSVSSLFPPFQCCSCVVKNFNMPCWPPTLIWGMGVEGKVALPNWQKLRVNSWLWKFLKTLKNSHENVPTILSKAVASNTNYTSYQCLSTCLTAVLLESKDQLPEIFLIFLLFKRIAKLNTYCRI